MVLLGGGGGRIKGGRVLTYDEKPDRQMCRLYLSMMDKMQVRMPKFGDASQPLDECPRVGLRPRRRRPIKADDYSQEPFVVEERSTEIVFENDGTDTRNFKVRVRIQSGAGVQQYAVLTLAYQSSSQSIDIDYVRIHKPDGTVVLTPSENVQDLDSEITRQAPFL